MWGHVSTQGDPVPRLCGASQQYLNPWGCDLSEFLYWGNREGTCHFNSFDLAPLPSVCPPQKLCWPVTHRHHGRAGRGRGKGHCTHAGHD